MIEQVGPNVMAMVSLPVPPTESDESGGESED